MSELKHALILTYGSPRPGCEDAAIGIHARMTAHLEAAREAGDIEAAHAYLVLTGDRSERMGMAIVEGTREQMVELFWNKEWKGLLTQAGALTHHVRSEFGVGGEPASLAGPAAVFSESISALGG